MDAITQGQTHFEHYLKLNFHSTCDEHIIDDYVGVMELNSLSLDHLSRFRTEAESVFEQYEYIDCLTFSVPLLVYDRFDKSTPFFDPDQTTWRDDYVTVTTPIRFQEAVG